ncbi:hypothetical protein EV1_013281 [Malus domestica]
MIAAVYVDNMNLIRTPEDLVRTAAHLKLEFEMKDLGKTQYCLSLKIGHCSDGILVHQLNCTQKGDEEILEPEVPYLNTISTLLYLAQCTRPEISFVVNLLARYSNAPTRRHWTGVKDIFCYLKDTTDLGLFYPYESSSDDAPSASRVDSRLVGYADEGYLSDPHKLTPLVGHIRSSCDLYLTVDVPRTIFEDNVACIKQLKKGYIKGDNTKHIALKFFFSHKKQEYQKIEVTQIHSQDNLADLFTKSLPKTTFQKLVHGIGMRKLFEL